MVTSRFFSSLTGPRAEEARRGHSGTLSSVLSSLPGTAVVAVDVEGGSEALLLLGSTDAVDLDTGTEALLVPLELAALGDLDV